MPSERRWLERPRNTACRTGSMHDSRRGPDHSRSHQFGWEYPADTHGNSAMSLFVTKNGQWRVAENPISTEEPYQQCQKHRTDQP